MFPNVLKRIHVVALFLLGVLVGGVFVYLFFYTDVPDVGVRVIEQRENMSVFRYINPLIECSLNEGEGFSQLNLTQNDLRDFIVGLETNAVKDVSVYVRDLNNGPWFGVGEDLEYAPASLTKVPVMMAVYKRAESDPDILKKIIHTPSSLEPTLEQKIASQKIQPNYDYTIEELVRRSIIYSDNLAVTFAMQGIEQDDLAKVFQSINVPFEVSNNDLMLSVREYAAFFRVLYNASFLSREHSELALALLTESEFQNGIVAGVPKGIAVAHKFGERNLASVGQDTIHQIHDCGIVYYPEQPYLMCVMTRGYSLSKQEEAIAEVSRFVYERVRKGN